MLREEDNLLESYKELEANKGAVLKAAGEALMWMYGR